MKAAKNSACLFYIFKNRNKQTEIAQCVILYYACCFFALVIPCLVVCQTPETKLHQRCRHVHLYVLDFRGVGKFIRILSQSNRFPLIPPLPGVWGKDSNQWHLCFFGVRMGGQTKNEPGGFNPCWRVSL
jgi:hypothetical protein